MKEYIFILYVVLVPTVYVNSKTIYNDRFNSERLKSRYAAADDDQMIMAEEPAMLPYGPAPSPYMYQRYVPYVYGEYYRPRQKYRYMEERPAYKRSEYQKRFYEEPLTEKRQCRVLGRRSVSYAKQPLKLVSLKEDNLYVPESSALERNARGSSYLYGMGKQDDMESDLNEFEETDLNTNSKFTDDKYPTVLANFKIGSKLDKKSIAQGAAFEKREFKQNDSSIAKESSSKFSESKTSSFAEKSNDFEDKDSDTDGKVAEELRDILDYMGLIDEDNHPDAKLMEEKADNTKDESKESYEDENMEEGSNKISLAREEHKSTAKERNKRDEEMFESTESSTTANDDSESTSQNNLQENEKFKRSLTAVKRQDDNSTLSGKSSIVEESIPTLAEEGSESNDYEKRVERQIQSRINALKEEVKREIAALKAQEAAQAVHNLNEDTQRKKRQAVNTLLDEESSMVDPALHPDDVLKPHVRKRRNISEDKSENLVSASQQNVTADGTTLSSETRDASVTPTKAETFENDETKTFGSAAFSPSEDVNTEELRTLEQSNNSATYRDKEIRKDGAHSRKRKKRDVQYEMNYAPYRGDEYVEDEEDGETEYDGFYDIVSHNMPIKRQIKRSTDFKGLIPRLRRQTYGEDLSSFHGGGPAENHLRIRSMNAKPRVKRRIFSKRQANKRDQPQTLTDMSDSDIFGALPQGFDGELNRFKRVKRTKDKG